MGVRRRGSPCVGDGWMAVRASTTGGVGGTEPSAALVEQDSLLDVRPFAVTRGAAEQTTEPEASLLPRARLRATILLEVGSEPGAYEDQIQDAKEQPRASSAGSAAIIDFVATLKTSLDMSALLPRSYELAVRREGEKWRLFPAEVK